MKQTEIKLWTLVEINKLKPSKRDSWILPVFFNEKEARRYSVKDKYCNKKVAQCIIKITD